MPQRFAAPAGAGSGTICEGIYQRSLMPDREMQMRIFGQPRETDPAKRLPSFDCLARLYHQAAPGHVAILGFPALRMFDHNAVATFDVANSFGRGLAKGAVWRAVSCAKNTAACGSEDIHAGLLRRQ